MTVDKRTYMREYMKDYRTVPEHQYSNSKD